MYIKQIIIQGFKRFARASIDVSLPSRADSV